MCIEEREIGHGRPLDVFVCVCASNPFLLLDSLFCSVCVCVCTFCINIDDKKLYLQVELKARRCVSFEARTWLYCLLTYTSIYIPLYANTNVHLLTYVRGPRIIIACVVHSTYILTGWDEWVNGYQKHSCGFICLGTFYNIVNIYTYHETCSPFLFHLSTN